MVNKCAAFNCCNSGNSLPKRSFHRFPLKDLALLARWVVAVRRENFTPSPTSTLCSDHFLTSDFQVRPGASYRLLKAEAVPSVFSFPEHLQRKTTTRRVLKRTYPADEGPSDSVVAALGEASCTSAPDPSHDHSYNINEEKTIENLWAANSRLRKRVKTIGNQNRRQDKSLSRIKDLMAELRSKCLLESEAAAVIEKCFDGPLHDLMKNELDNLKTPASGRRYSQEMKQFAVTLHYYSPQAYEYCRSVLTLPHVSSMRNWLSNVECEPGFLSNVMDLCAASHCSDYSLVIDSMFIKQSTNYSNGKFAGFCEYGEIVAEDSKTLCSEALVFLLVPLTFSKLQYPVGYFLADKVNSRVQVELVNEVLRLTAEKHIRIRNITCDGAAANQALLKSLGCKLDPLDPKPYFSHPVLEYNVYGTLDICHMLKLSRNALADFKTFHTADDQRICWQYIINLSDMQEKIGLHFANKLTSHHTNWQKQKMKVKLAAQTFSRSVADAMQYLNQRGADYFHNCEATIEFIRQMDRAFDVLNSRSKFGKYFKRAITPSNIESIQETYSELKDYLLSLNDPNHKPLYTSRRRTFIVGFICTFYAVLLLAKDLFNSKTVSYLPTFRISQDLIETLFSKIRRMGRHNNNPTSLQFKAALRNLLVKQQICASKSSNCLDTESSCSVFALKWSKRSTPLPCEDAVLTDDLLQKLVQLDDCEQSVYKENILTYISGYIVRTLQGKVSCSTCAEYLIGESNCSQNDHVYCSKQSSSQLLTAKDRGGLITPAKAVCDIVTRCEKVIGLFVDRKFMSQSNLDKKILALFNRSAFEDKPVQFFTHPCDIEEGMLSHCIQLTQKIAQKYIDITLKHHSRLFNKQIIERGLGRTGSVFRDWLFRSISKGIIL